MPRASLEPVLTDLDFLKNINYTNISKVSPYFMPYILLLSYIVFNNFSKICKLSVISPVKSDVKEEQRG